ncbi:MAG: bifunctional UDP-N-acetylglucosamine diphosphorylase/glucosamine-1-phosphate N-acetyltransferase GlmU [Gammaproteobacteria bacterium]|jgi:bifunctional UDP-N-acetylglucosamine pyrophosphorylase/glucosamine-1-phosphate N-acetyltransferase
MKLSVIILAAGDGKRMRSNLPKVLHEVAGKPLLQHVIDVAKQLKPQNIYVVYGEKGGEQVMQQIGDMSVTWVKQAQPLGTGHAVLQVLPFLKSDHRVLILYGDVPLIAVTTLEKLIKTTPANNVGWLTMQVDNPIGLGRIIRDTDGHPQAIVEERDADTAQKKIKEIFTGICLMPVKYLEKWLAKLSNKNAQGEYYLTEIFAHAIDDGIKITTNHPVAEKEILGVNSKDQLAKLERIWQLDNANQCMLNGLTLRDPSRFDVRGTLKFGQDVVCDVNVIIEGNVVIGNNCYIGPHVYLRDVTIADNVGIFANTMIDKATIEEGCLIGPFSRVRPETVLHSKAKIGNFVEIKKSDIGSGSKINHLSYVGDTVMGAHVNVGAGTITCNYDGVHKYKTTIEDNVFIGSSTQLIAPLTVGHDATIGAGSTITQDVPSDYLTLARTKQVTIEGWQKPSKK